MKAPRTLGIGRSNGRQIPYAVEQLAKVTSNISFGTTTSNADGDMNMQCWKATGTSPAGANTEFAVAHGLTHIPFGFMIISTNKAAHIYKSTTAWTAATNSSLGAIYLKSDAASVAFVIVIL